MLNILILLVFCPNSYLAHANGTDAEFLFDFKWLKIDGAHSWTIIEPQSWNLSAKYSNLEITQPNFAHESRTKKNYSKYAPTVEFLSLQKAYSILFEWPSDNSGKASQENQAIPFVSSDNLASPPINLA